MENNYYNNNDYLARRIAEETVKAQIEARNRHLNKVWKITLIVTAIISAPFIIFFGLIFLSVILNILA